MLGKSIRTEAKEALDALSEKKVSVVLDFIDYLREREEWQATDELLSDKKLLRDYRKAREEIRKGKTVKWRSIRRNV
jgi:PHD/YefM family antitoxin component YafN of YafNO toxin-antitoxin module